MKKLFIVLLIALTCVCLTLSACKKKAEEAAPATPPTEQVAPAPEAAAPAPEAAAPAPEAAAPAPEAAAPAPEAAPAEPAK